MSAPEEDLLSIYTGWLSITIDETGVSMPHAIARAQDGGVTVYALALPVEEAYRLMLSEWATKKPAELIFAFDRFTKPSQGTTLGDVMAGWHFKPGAGGPFIIEYQHEPRILKPICWDNAWWNAALVGELGGVARGLAAGVRP